MSGPSLDARRKLLRDLQRSRADAVLAGDRFLRDLLDQLARHVKHSVAYAENRRYYAWDGRDFAGLKMHSLPPRQNAGDNRQTRGVGNAR